jgi:phenylalanyl-tRNA synthetase alpha chain
MPSDLPTLRQDFDAALAAAKSTADLKTLRDGYLGRKSGRLSLLLKGLGGLSPEERRTVGAEANALKQHMEAALAAAEEGLAVTGRPAGAVDVTLPGRRPAAGRRHPLTQVTERIEDIFLAMGYQIIEGPELEDDWHNFEALNMPPEHPARDMQDTLYLGSPVPAPDAGRAATLLRTHTSGMQIRYMEANEPPVRVIAPGGV